MAGLVPAIHDFDGTKNVDARGKPGHDEFCSGGSIARIC
jgi:hypothetical protein